VSPTAALVAPATLALVEVTGTDRISYLEAVTSQALADAAPGEVRGALHLDVHGAPLQAFDVLVHPERLWLLTPTAELADEVVTVLGGRTFLSDAVFTRRDDLAAASLRGPAAGDLAVAAHVPVGIGRWDSDDEVVRVGREAGIDLLGDPEALGELTAALVAAGAVQGDAADLEDARIRAGEPAWGIEVAGPHLPEELGLLPSHVHLAKGCYPGQEAVARMWQLGKPRRQLAVVAASAPLAAGFQLGEGRRKVTVTSATRDGEVALAFVPGDAAAGDTLDGPEGTVVTVQRIVGADRPVPGADPQVTRRRDARAARSA
jgi:tRNA-modifying protein YgfZ